MRHDAGAAGAGGGVRPAQRLWARGWLATLCGWLGVEYGFSPYGLQGILLAHLFFNLPLATRLLLQALENIPVEQRQLAAQLGMNGWQQFRFVEWPALRRQILPSGALIFMLCFASFATVLSLGGGPQATTIELAIYRALSYDYDLGRAAMLALIQLSCCLGLVLISQRLSRAAGGPYPRPALAQPGRQPVAARRRFSADRRRAAAAAAASAGGDRRRRQSGRRQRAAPAGAVAGAVHVAAHRPRRRAVVRGAYDDAAVEQPRAEAAAASARRPRWS